MQRFVPLLMRVWRTACQHTEIHEATSRIVSVLRKRMPVETVLVRSIDIARSCIETVGAGASERAAVPRCTRTSLDSEDLERLLAWCRRGEIIRLPEQDGPVRQELLIPEALEGQTLVGPLNSEEDPIGLLLLNARPPQSFEDVHVQLAGALVEPFSVALDKDRELRAVRARRQAAEADRHSLLTKLGRQEISEAIVGAESGLRTVMDRVDLVSPSDVPVLLFGETGSGKEVIARAVHARSGRQLGPFLRVNCGAIPPELIDSELFGHERGSFTGAIAMRKGWFERADGGTLFLDEVGELPLAAQVRLLRVLQDGTLERVGGQRVLTVDVRVVAATNRDLQNMVAEGRFRDDLWYRLAVFPITVPSLRDRPEDMPALATHFALRAAKRFGLPILVPSPEDVNRLLAYDWPGNIRELAAVIDRAAILGNGKRLEIAKALGVTHGPASSRLNVAGTPITATQGSEEFPSLDAVAARHIETALRATRGRIEGPQGAAAMLGINPHTLRARMRKLSVNWKKFREGDSPG